MNVETVVPGLADARARERFNRAFAFSRLTWTVCGEELRALTPATRLELQLTQNAFGVSGIEPAAGDVFAFLWLLNAKRRTPPAGLLDRLRGAWAQRKLRARVRKLNLALAAREIREFLVAQIQDRTDPSGQSGTDYSPWIFWMAAEACWWLSVHRGFSFAEYLSTPYPVLQQLRRAFEVYNPETRIRSDGAVEVVEPTFQNESDRLLGAFVAARREALGALHRQNRYRRQ